MINIIEEQSEASRLEQLAEECAELGHAALKLARKRRGESPTPERDMTLIDKITTEAGDVLACLDQLADIIDGERVNRCKENKTIRWKIRLEEAKVEG